MNEVKRQAMSEVQKAVAEAEQKAFEMIASERARMEQTIADAKRQATEDAFLVINEQEESTEVRWLGTSWEGTSKGSQRLQVLPSSDPEPAGPLSLLRVSLRSVTQRPR